MKSELAGVTEWTVKVVVLSPNYKEESICNISEWLVTSAMLMAESS